MAVSFIGGGTGQAKYFYQIFVAFLVLLGPNVAHLNKSNYPLPKDYIYMTNLVPDLVQ